VLLLHPGGWDGGDKVDLESTATRLAQAGYVVANANYRLASSTVRFPVPLQDSWCALAWLRLHAGELELDPRRIAVMGYSAGANLALMMGLNPTSPTQAPDCPNGATVPPVAVVSGSGPSDLTTLADPTGQVAKYIGQPLSEAPELYRAASPVAHVGPGAPPILLIHGTVDFFVDNGQSEELYGALKAAGDEVTLLQLAGSGHTLNPGADEGAGTLGTLSIDEPEAWPVIVDFLMRTIGAPSP
jgi:acetyl esterase/lipase